MTQSRERTHETLTHLVTDQETVKRLMSHVPDYGGLVEELSTSQAAIHSAALVDEFGLRRGREIARVLAGWPKTAGRYQRVLELMESEYQRRPFTRLLGWADSRAKRRQRA
jgi:hypothetical protein